MRCNFKKYTPTLTIFGTHNLQTIKYNNTLINELLLMLFYLFNIRPKFSKLHHQKWLKLRVTLFWTFSTSPAAADDAVLRPSFIWKLCYILQSIVTFTFIQNFDQNLVFFRLLNDAMLTGSVTRNFQNSHYFRCRSGLNDKKSIKSKPTRKLKHANSLLAYFEYFCQMSSKSINVIFSYTVSKLVRFFWDTVYCFITMRKVYHATFTKSSTLCQRCLISTSDEFIWNMHAFWVIMIR